MLDNVNFSTLKQSLFNFVAGGAATFAVGSLGVHTMRFLQGHSFRGIASDHPLMTCAKVAALTLPLFYLYEQYGDEYTPNPLHVASWEIISLASAWALIQYSETKVTPTLTLALILSQLTWKILAFTHKGSEILGLGD
jgi:hypothetical protein